MKVNNPRTGACLLVLFLLMPLNGIADQKSLAQSLNSAKSRLASLENARSTLALNHDLQASLNRLLEEEAALEDELARQTETLAAIQSEKLEAIINVRKKAAGESIGTLKLPSGKTYVDAVIREVSDVGISISHSSGSARIASDALPVEMQERFQFNPETAAAILQAERDSTLRHHAHAIAVGKPTSITNQRSPKANTNHAPEKPESPPKGHITARIVGYRDGSKSVEFACIANCDASLTVHGAVRYPPSYIVTFQIAKGQSTTHTVLVRNRYSADLKTSDGRMLDQESSGRKSGLGSTRLNN